MDSAYIDTVRLLIAVMPEVFRTGTFALKGGTGINLFVNDMPRLSVDIDVVYPDWSVPRDDALRSIAEELNAIAVRLSGQGLAVRVIAAKGRGEGKLVVSSEMLLVKVEANLIFRGTVLPVERRPLSQHPARMFSSGLVVPVLAIDELYGSKLVAALDRQHPRDLFDVWMMYETHGLTERMIECFVLYLAGHNRPMHEVLRPSRQDMTRDFEASFAGMPREPVALTTLEAVRERLMSDLPRRLSRNQRKFLISIARNSPDWSLTNCAHASALPAIQWRLKNLEGFRDRRPPEWEQQARALEAVLSE